MSASPQVVLQNLLMCMVCFYSLYYVVVSLCIGLLRYAQILHLLQGMKCKWERECLPRVVPWRVSRVHEINSLLAPFDYTTQPSWQNPKYLGEWH